MASEDFGGEFPVLSFVCKQIFKVYLRLPTCGQRPPLPWEGNTSTEANALESVSSKIMMPYMHYMRGGPWQVVSKWKVKRSLLPNMIPPSILMSGYALALFSYSTPSPHHKHITYSMSFASSLRKLLPSNRPEKGHTIRTRGKNFSESLQDDAHTFANQEEPTSDSRGESADRIVRWNTAIEPSPSSNSTPSTRTQQLYLAHREKRRLRRSLRESGDYLGVQGVNPATGELDVLTPTSSSAASEFASLARTVADKRGAYEAARRRLQAEKMRKWERDKEAIRAERRGSVRWTKRRSGWSSAIEPALSPIAQSSSAGTTPRGGESTGTVVRTPSARHASEDDTEQARAAGALRRKPVPLSAAARTVSSQRSYSDLIPVESEFRDQSSPRPPPVGPKPVG